MHFLSFRKMSLLAVSMTAAIILTVPATGHAEATDKATLKAESAKFNTYYQGSKVWRANAHGDAYNKIITPGAVLTIRVPGIYANVANLNQPMPLTIIENGTPTLPKGNSGGSRELKPGEKVFLTEIKSTGDTLHFEILTAQQVALGDAVNTRYRGELDFHVPNLQTINTFAALKALVDPIMTADAIDTPAPNIAPTTPGQTRTVNLGMSTEEVEQALGSPDKIMNLGPKTIFVYKDVKVFFTDSKVADVQ